MKLVVDANIVFSSLLRSDGIVGDVFFNSRPPLVLYAPDLLREEIAEHRAKLVKLSKRSSDTMLELELLTLSRITFLNEGLISTVNWAKTREVMTGLDADDENYVALAIQLGAPLWTGGQEVAHRAAPQTIRPVGFNRRNTRLAPQDPMSKTATVHIVNKSRHPLPSYATEHSAGMDLRANLDVSIILAPGQRALVKTGLFLELPEGTEAQVRPRSGLAFKHGVTVLNAPGTIDADYRGEVGVLLINHGQEPFEVKDGERIAQLVIARYVRVAFEEVVDLASSERGAGGFGHTGTN